MLLEKRETGLLSAVQTMVLLQPRVLLYYKFNPV